MAIHRNPIWIPATLLLVVLVLPEPSLLAQAARVYSGLMDQDADPDRLILWIQPGSGNVSAVRGEWKAGSRRIAVNGSFYAREQHLSASAHPNAQLTVKFDGELSPQSDSFLVELSREGGGLLRTVELYRANGKDGGDMAVVPDVTALGEEGAAALLRAVGVQDVFTVYESKDVTENNFGTVKSQAPAAGAKIPRSGALSTVAITVYHDPDLARVPDLAGLGSRSEIVSRLEAEGFSAAFGPEETTPPAEKFAMVRQIPGPSTLFKKGKAVSVTIREPAEPETAMSAEGTFVVTAPYNPGGEQFSMGMLWKPVDGQRADVTIGVRAGQFAEMLKGKGADLTATFSAQREGDGFVVAGAELETWVARIFHSLDMDRENFRVRKATLSFVPNGKDFDINFFLHFTWTFQDKDDSYQGNSRLFAKRQ